MKHITVICSGTMGNGIAHVFAQHGFYVALVDNNQEALDRATKIITGNLDRQLKKGIIDQQHKSVTLSNISTFTNLKKAVLNADLVVEAATENKETKLNLFKQFDG